MKQDKELLLKDLCARLPYGLYVQDEYGDIVYISYNDVHFANYFDSVLNGTIKPYLFPLLSMTEEERIAIGNEFAYGQPHKAMDLLHKRHIDYRGLIPMGLAIDATGLNIY